MIAQIDPIYVRTRPYKIFSRFLSYACFEGRALTTRGRWINPLVFKFFNTLLKIPIAKKVEKPIFIIGTGRSGTTILGVIMSMHKAIGFLNEPKAIWHMIYPGEDIIGSYSRGLARIRLTEKYATEEVIKTAKKLFGAYLSYTLSDRLLDKYPELIFRVPFVKKIFPNAKFIFIVRNGLHTCHSIKTWSIKHGKKSVREKHDWWGVNNRKWKLLIEQIVETDSYFENELTEIKKFSRQIDMAAVEWIVTMREGLNLMERLPDAIYMLRYEYLVAYPRETLKELLRFCDLSLDHKMLDFGCSKLKPQAKKNYIDIHPSIQTIFNETLHKLGYAA